MNKPEWKIRAEPPPNESQLEALKSAWMRPNYGLFLRMGRGKTAALYADFVAHMEAETYMAPTQLLIVCPNAVKAPTWAEEYNKWEVYKKIHNLGVWGEPLYADFDSLNCVEGVKKPEHLASVRILVINYEALTNTNFRGFQAAKGFCLRDKTMIALDESIRIKSPSSKSFRNVSQLANLCVMRRALTGKPMAQGPHDAFSQLKFLGGTNRIRSFTAFKRRYCVMGGYMGKKVIDARNKEELNKLIRQVAFWEKKSVWEKGLPKAVYSTRMVELAPDQKTLYARMSSDFFVKLNELKEESLASGTEIMATQVVSALLKLQQISSGFVYDAEKRPHDLIRLESNPKINAIHEVLEQVEGKVIIFAIFKHSVNQLVSAFKSSHGALCIRGGMSSEGISSIRNSFNNDPKHRIIVCQTASAKHGLTLIGGKGDDACATTIYFENNFSLDDREQSESRNRRQNLDAEYINYVDLVSSNIESVCIKALQKKEKLIDSIMEMVP